MGRFAPPVDPWFALRGSRSNIGMRGRPQRRSVMPASFGPVWQHHLGVFVDVPSRDDALEWAAKIAVACRSAQEVRQLLPDPTA